MSCTENKKRDFFNCNKGTELVNTNIYANISSRIIDYIDGNKNYVNNQEYFDLLGKEFKEKLSSCLAYDKGKETQKNLAAAKMVLWLDEINFKSTEYGLVAHCIEEDGAEIKSMSKAFTGLPGDYGSLYKELNKNMVVH